MTTTTLENATFLRALRRQTTHYTPIWIMRQAGRYLPEYRAVRAKAGSFLNLCKTPELACSVTLQPLARFKLDAAIIFSDILMIPDAMGLELSLTENIGIKFQYATQDEQRIRQLTSPDPNTDLAYVMSAIRLVRHELANNVPLIGFAGSPWTVATYMVEGGSSKTFATIHKMRYQAPDLLHQLLNTLTHATTLYLQAQIDAGVNALMLFDTWGGILTASHYREFSLQYMQQIVTHIKQSHPHIPIILYTKGNQAWLETIAMSGCAAVGLDWMTELGEARQRIGQQVALQGNLDPACLYATPAVIRQHVATLLQQYGQGAGHIFNLGHGIAPDVNPDHVAVLVDAVHELSQPYHKP